MVKKFPVEENATNEHDHSSKSGSANLNKDCNSYCEMLKYFTVFLIVKLVARNKNQMSAKLVW